MRFFMKIKATINSKEESCAVPSNYRQNIASLIKEAIKTSEPSLYEKYWGNNSPIEKPFTFSLKIFDPKYFNENKKSFIESLSGRMELLVSSNNPAFAIACYNGLLSVANRYNPFSFETSISNFYLCPEVEFNYDESIFKTISPFVVRNMEERDDDNKKGKEYLTFKDKNFVENLFASISHLCKEFLPHKVLFSFEDFVFTPIDCVEVGIYHYGHVIKATSGTFKLKADREILKLIYDVGLGARRSQGFGMLEVVR